MSESSRKIDGISTFGGLAVEGRLRDAPRRVWNGLGIKLGLPGREVGGLGREVGGSGRLVGRLKRQVGRLATIPGALRMHC